jgi:hypothetical protein
MCCLLSSSSRCTTAKNKLTTLPGRVRKHFASIRLQRQMDVEQSYQDLCLDGLEVCLPSQVSDVCTELTEVLLLVR